MSEFKPDYAIHPSETILEILNEKNLTPSEFSELTNVPVDKLVNILVEKSSIDKEMAIELEKLGPPQSFWLNLQKNYDETIERLFQEAYEDLDAQDISEFNLKGFIENCEQTYKMTTEEFHKWYKENDYEGNVDKQLWYQFTSK